MPRQPRHSRYYRLAHRHRAPTRRTLNRRFANLRTTWLWPLYVTLLPTHRLPK